ncbi:unnamed protein product, partial [Sphacelaria rigidula]
ALRRKVDEEGHLKICGGLRKGIGVKAYLHGPMDAARNLKLRLRLGHLDLPERRKGFTSNNVFEEEVDGQNCLCGKAMESRSHIDAECELYK